MKVFNNIKNNTLEDDHKQLNKKARCCFQNDTW